MKSEVSSWGPSGLKVLSLHSSGTGHKDQAGNRLPEEHRPSSMAWTSVSSPDSHIEALTSMG